MTLYSKCIGVKFEWGKKIEFIILNVGFYVSYRFATPFNPKDLLIVRLKS